MPNAPKKFLDLSGFTFSGKQAVIELLREFDGFHVPHFEFEFPLIRVQDGIADLEKALVDDWSPIRCAAAIRRFKKLIDILARKPTRYRIGYDYDSRYQGKFSEISRRYISNLVDMEWEASWPFAWHDYSTLELLWHKIQSKFRIEQAFESTLYLCSGRNFLELTRSYLEEILTIGVDPDKHTIVMHNAIEPFNPTRGLNYFENAQLIVVDRDPRDNYIASISHSRLYQKIAAANNVDQFIQRYGILRNQAAKAQNVDPRVLHIQYEDLIWNYQETVDKITDFLNISANSQRQHHAFFNPKESAKYVGMWKKYPKQNEIRRIEEKLGEYCVECPR